MLCLHCIDSIWRNLVLWRVKRNRKFQFVAYFAGKYFWNYNCEIHFDGNTDKAIPAGDIVELIPYTVDRYYFNE